MWAVQLVRQPGLHPMKWAGRALRGPARLCMGGFSTTTDAAPGQHVVSTVKDPLETEPTPSATPPSDDTQAAEPDGLKDKVRFSLLVTAKQYIENYDFTEAQRYLDLAAALMESREDAMYLHLLTLLRLKEGHIAEAAATRDKMLELYPEMREDPVVLCNAAWLYCQEGKLEEAMQCLDRAGSFGLEVPKDSLYVRAMVHAHKGETLEAAELLRAVVKTKAEDLQSPLDLKLGLLYSEVLCLDGRFKEAHEVMEPTYAACKRIISEDHVFCNCVAQGLAIVHRGTGQYFAATKLLRPVVAAFKAQLGAHRLTTTAMEHLCRTQLDIFFFLHRTQPQSKGKLTHALNVLGTIVTEWEKTVRQVAPDSMEHGAAIEHKEMIPLLRRYLDAAPLPSSPQPPDQDTPQSLRHRKRHQTRHSKTKTVGGVHEVASGSAMPKREAMKSTRTGTSKQEMHALQGKGGQKTRTHKGGGRNQSQPTWKGRH